MGFDVKNVRGATRGLPRGSPILVLLRSSDGIRCVGAGMIAPIILMPLYSFKLHLPARFFHCLPTKGPIRLPFSNLIWVVATFCSCGHSGLVTMCWYHLSLPYDMSTRWNPVGVKIIAKFYLFCPFRPLYFFLVFFPFFPSCPKLLVARIPEKK